KVGRAVAKLESGYAQVLLKDGKKIPERSIEALRTLMENGFVMKYGALSRRFTAEVGFWWNDQPPESEIGLLRLHGLVAVGKMPMHGRLFRVALIPVDLRQIVMDFLNARSSTPVVERGELSRRDRL